ncbi:MAG: hypothetical protein JF599_07015 [Verrucomicrobia bacterium]|nr:hypothetical protein [Verrucomicrobiota bacterium]
MAHGERHLIFLHGHSGLRRAVALALMLGLLSVARGQSAPATSPHVEVAFTVFSLNRLDGLHYQPKVGASLLALEFFTQTRSALYHYAGEPALAFYEANPLPDAGDPAARPVAVAFLPPGIKRVLLLFAPLTVPAADGRKYGVTVVDDSFDRLPPGHLAVLNAAAASYVAQIGGRRITVECGLSEAVPASGKVRIAFTRFLPTGWARVASHELSMNARSRVCLVLFPPASPTGLAPQIRTLVDEARGSDSRSMADE